MINLGFDIDGCMNCLKQDIILYGKKYCEDNRIDYNLNLKGYYFKEIFDGISKYHNDYFWETYGYELYTKDPKENVTKALNELKRNGCNLYAITTRNPDKNFNGISFKKITEDWLSANDINVEIIYTKDKLKYVKDLNIKCMVEDKPKNIELLKNITNVLIYHQLYNEDIEGTHVHSWKEVYEFITRNIIL